MREDPFSEDVGAQRGARVNFEPDPRPQRPKGTGKRRGPGKASPRDHQLAEQVFRVLCLVFPDLDDDLLSSVQPASVTPAPDGSRMLVRLRATDPERVIDVGELLERLARAKGHLRSEIAAEIHRKRTPDLTFDIAGDEE